MRRRMRQFGTALEYRGRRWQADVYPAAAGYRWAIKDRKSGEVRKGCEPTRARAVAIVETTINGR